MSMSGEEKDNSLVEDSLRAKLLEVGQLRKDIEDLRTAISDRYAQDMGENCVTQWHTRNEGALMPSDGVPTHQGLCHSQWG